MAKPNHSLDSPDAPDWSSLFDIAESQAGYFTTRQAAGAGYSPQLLSYLVGSKIERIRRGIYRLVHFPASDGEDLVVLWLWSEQAGVFSHETALALHDLSDALPGKVHMTVPRAWSDRRLRVPPGLVLHYAEISATDRASFGAVPLTTPRRTLADCIEANVDPDLVFQGLTQARRRGLLTDEEESQLRDGLFTEADTR